MESLEKDWLEYPVLHLDLSGVSYDSKEVLSEVLNRKLSGWEHQYGVSAMSDIPGLRFQDVIDAAYAKTGRQVVILIDEYDKPIIDNLDRPSVQEYNRSVLQDFYSVLNAKDGCIRFGFLTGVTKIGETERVQRTEQPARHLAAAAIFRYMRNFRERSAQVFRRERQVHSRVQFHD